MSGGGGVQYVVQGGGAPTRHLLKDGCVPYFNETQ